MTLNQLNSLDENELSICLYVMNILHPVKPPIEISPRGLTWIKHDVLVKKLLDVFQQVKPEYHPLYSSLMQKLGIKVEINPIPSPQNEATASNNI